MALSLKTRIRFSKVYDIVTFLIIFDPTHFIEILCFPYMQRWRLVGASRLFERSVDFYLLIVLDHLICVIKVIFVLKARN